MIKLKSYKILIQQLKIQGFKLRQTIEWLIKERYQSCQISK